MSLELGNNNLNFSGILGLNNTFTKIENYINDNVNTKYSVSVNVTSAQLDVWGQDDVKSIELIPEVEGKFINVTQVRVIETGTPSQDYIDNYEGGTIALYFGLQYPGQMEYYQITSGITGAGSNVQYIAIEQNSIFLESVGVKYDAGTLAYTFEIEYELIDLV